LGAYRRKEMSNLDLQRVVVALTKDECANLLDALNEWCEVVGPKELEDNEEGLDATRYNAIVIKLRNAQEGGEA
jgi:hypothetical protein